ncbi:restriction endonuclease subunit S [Algoriphagus persicinus]|uniref:restriction endonuclease subunit S n=1 Tax=Algoriphagus persicinus TaxID=3108754 RepID=UPI002B3BB42F|nr:restriction endonuclease subunit S [Algoriphagus sp. E1-3-M2]MEB2785515.1 restriction endonuclease subunit S [Algoriphagus sp. E1-3-M2]
MSKHNEFAPGKANGLVPELRFPEFEDDGGWEEKSVGEVYDFKVTNSFSREYLNYEKGVVKNIHYGDIHTKFNTLFDIEKEKVPYINQEVSIENIKAECYCIEGDIVFADASEDLNDVGKSIEIINLNKEKLVSGLHTLLARQRESKLVSGFAGYLFKSYSIRKQIQKEAQGAKVLGISATRISKVRISLPDALQEQQKIASCLSSLDEVIAAHSQKLELLKDHKKGLMQNLFPQEGETLPKVRFKEFEKDGEWMERKLGELASFSSGGTPSKGNTQFWNGDIPWISASSMHYPIIEKSELNITQAAVDNGAKIAKKGSLLILVRGSMLHKRIPICITTRDVAFNQDVKALKLGNDATNIFLFYLLSSYEETLLELVSETGIGAGKLDTEYLKKLVIHLPPLHPEQQKISSCLSALDELISAQAERIAQLQQHKKGLMQGLFPKIDN